MWFVYILKCSDNTFYTGITTNIERRLIEHNISDKAAKYTRARRPVEVLYESKFLTKSDASKEEYRIKKLTRKEKEDLIKKEIRRVYNTFCASLEISNALLFQRNK